MSRSSSRAPLINLLYPELSGFIQPLSGEYAGRRSLLESIPFFTGYAVEIGHLIDIYGRVGLDGLGQVDLERRVHRNQELEGLSKMSFVILQAVLTRLETGRRASLFAELGSRMKLPTVELDRIVPRGDRALRPGAAAHGPDTGVRGTTQGLGRWSCTSRPRCNHGFEPAADVPGDVNQLSVSVRE